jgi:hypothetical protein
VWSARELRNQSRQRVEREVGDEKCTCVVVGVVYLFCAIHYMSVIASVLYVRDMVGGAWFQRAGRRNGRSGRVVRAQERLRLLRNPTRPGWRVSCFARSSTRRRDAEAQRM